MKKINGLATLLTLILGVSQAFGLQVKWTDYVYDHNGNVTELLDGDTGEIIGEYAYDPYGNTIKIKGEAAHENKVRFSTKEVDESGLYYYGYRYYNPQDGRWLNRDPIEEEGGQNLYTIAANNTLDNYDVLGLQMIPNEGTCCNNSGTPEWVLIDNAWEQLPPGECVGGWGSGVDCDGMTCGSQFEKSSTLPGGGADCPTNTPHSNYPCGSGESPTDRGAPNNNHPGGGNWLDPADCPCYSPQGCIVEGTLITMADGTKKLVENIEIGDIVLSWDEKSNNLVKNEVSEIISPQNNEFVEITTGSNTLTLTRDHPIYIYEKGWSSESPERTKEHYEFFENIKINRFVDGDRCFEVKSCNSISQAVINTTKFQTKMIRTYNLKVRNSHCYFANNILVHNK